MFTVVTLQRANHGNHFRAHSLRGVAELIDPFLAVDHAWMSAPTFPPHPHAGISAVSYVFLDSETGIDNHDSIGTRNLIAPGGLHWTTAGRGVVHEEVPAEPGKTVHSLQIFVDLAAEKRTIAPFPLILEASEVPVVQLPGAKIRVPLGRFGDTSSPISPPTDVTMLDISLNEGASFDIPIPEGHSAFVMPIFGAIGVDGHAFERDDLKLPVFPAMGSGHTVRLSAPHGNAKAVLFSGGALHS